ncbi:MAG TPA: 1,2-phenylacetyl-CoA epoxidase subunit PaaA [Nitriliruptorales bacterium]|nr:1,2-phenylacetyl-CoA epoxidase subunit PaaA [Nitriliruptorales bacterium]
MADGPSASGPPNARSMLLTVLGDLVLPSGGQMWLGALTRTLHLLGITPAATRQAVRRLAGQGLIEPRRVGRLAAYSLTDAGRRRLEEAAERIYLRRRLVWDGRWRLLAYSFPEEHRASRDSLRRELEWLGYGSIGPALWACPWDLGARLDTVLAKHGVVGRVETFTSRADDGDDLALAGRAYDLQGLAARYRWFLAGFASAADAHDASEPEALRRRLILVHEWRKFLFLDPGLPPELTPPDWPGERAGRRFRDLYGAVEQPAWVAWGRIVADADPDGGVPPRPRSNLDARPRSPSPSGRTTDARRTEEFREGLAAGGKVEASDWMPDEYRQVAFRFIEMHANSELMGALPEREWIARAPTMRRKRSLAAKVQDEVGHAQLIYRAAEELGVKSRQQMADDLLAGRTKFHNVFHYSTFTWGDVACIGYLVDGAAIVTQRALLDTSYAVYLRIMRRVVAEESLHFRHGEDIMLALATGTQQQFEMLQEAVQRWWQPILLFFGHDTPAERDTALQWGIKTQTNEQARQEWLSTYIPRLWAMGVELPDRTLRYDQEVGRWTYGEPDWDELGAIIRGEGPMTRTRLAWRTWMRDSHAWLREVIIGDPPDARPADRAAHVAAPAQE